MENSPEITPHICSQLLYDKEAKNIQGRKDRLFSKWSRENWTATCRRMKLPLSNAMRKNYLKMDERLMLDLKP